MPPAGDPASLDVLKALGDNTRYAIYLELARSCAGAAGHRRDRRHPRACTPTPCGPTWNGIRERRTSLEAHTVRHRGCGPAAAPVLPSARRRPVSRPGAADCSPCLASHARPHRWPPTWGLTGDRGSRRRPANEGQRRLAAEPTATRTLPWTLLTIQLVAARVRSCNSWTDDDRRHRWPSPIARSQELAAAFPEVVCHLHRGMVEGLVGTLRRTARVQRVPQPARTVNSCQVDLVDAR